VNTEPFRPVFGIIEEGIALRMAPRRFAVQKLHNGILRAVQYYGYTADEILPLAPEISMAVDISHSNSIGDSAFTFLEGLRHLQGRYSPRERYESPEPDTLEWTLDRDMIYELYAPWMVQRRFNYKDPRLCRAIAEWLSISTTQDLIDIGTGIIDADEKGYISKRLYLWNLASKPEFGYKWRKVLPWVVNMLKACGAWEGRDEPRLRTKKTRSKKNAAGHRPADPGQRSAVGFG
jgi:hypothetical protein